MQAEVTAFQEECAKELGAAEPIIQQAEAALNSLDKASLGELKSFGSPAAEVVAVVSACMVLTAPGGKIPKVRCPRSGTSHKPRHLLGIAASAPAAFEWGKGLRCAVMLHPTSLMFAYALRLIAGMPS